MRTRALAVAIALAFVAAFLPSAGASQIESGLAEAPWPMFHHDLQHTGRSPLLGPEKPLLRWRYATGGAVKSSPAIGADGTIYVGSYDSFLYAINPGGYLSWRYATGGPIHSSPAIASDGTIYFGSNDGHLYALNHDGSLRWRYATGAEVLSSPAIGGDGTVYVCSDPISEGSKSGIYAVSPDGVLRWRLDLGRNPRYGAYSSPAISPNGTIIAGTPGGDVQATNPDGTLKWLLDLIVTPIWSSPAVAADGHIWIGSEYKAGLIVVEPDGSYGRDVGGVSYGADVTSSPAIGADGTIYFGVDDRGREWPGPGTGHVAAWDPAAPSNEWPLWSFQAENAVDSSPALGADGTVYVGSLDTYLYAINSDGTLNWRFKTGGGIFSSPAIGPGCTLYVGSDDGCIYAIQNGLVLQSGVDGYSGSEDTRIFKYAPATNLCTETQLQLGYKQQHSALLRFDLSWIPENAIVSEARLQVYAIGWGGAELWIDAFRVLHSVNVCQATWNQAQSGSNWTVPGCNGPGSDRASTPEDGVNANGPRRWYTWNVQSLVQAWVDGSLANNGVLLRASSASSTSVFRFASTQSEVVSQRPKLLVAYCQAGTTRPTRTPAPTPTATPTETPIPVETTLTLQYGADGYEYSDDTYLYRYAPTVNYCAINQFRVGYKQQNSALLRFELPTSLPAGAKIMRAELQIYTSGWGGKDTTIEAYRVLTYSNFCEATWEQGTGTDRWAVAGCNGVNVDRASTAESRITTSGPRKWYSLDVKGVVQAWANGSQDNHGILLRGASLTDTGLLYFASNETEPSSQRPRLVITYY